MPRPAGSSAAEALWCVRADDRQCLGGITTDREFWAQLTGAQVVTRPEVVAAVAWVRTSRPPGPALAVTETRSVFCGSEGEAVIVLEAERLRLVAEGWVEVSLDAG